MAEEKSNQQDDNRRNQPHAKKEKISNPAIPHQQRPAMNPGEDAAAKTTRKGAGQQQKSGGNSVVNS